MTPLVKFPNRTISLPLRYFGSISHYAAMGAFGRVIIDDTERFDKRKKEVHRMDIADTHGVMQLTVPISKPAERKPGGLHWSDITISRHGNWWDVHEQTLASAYGRTPFFEFYIDRLRRFFSKSTPDDFESIASLDLAINDAIGRILGFDNEIVAASSLEPGSERISTEDMGISVEYCKNNGSLAPKDGGSCRSEVKDVENLRYSDLEYSQGENLKTLQVNDVEYPQVRADKFGFIGNLSILDLIFNMGPESPLVLQKMI